MTTKRRANRPTLDLWYTSPSLLPGSEPEPEPVPPVLSPEALAFIEEMNGYGVTYDWQEACACGCPLTYALVGEASRYCCRCWPRSRRYGSDRQERIETLWARRPHNEW